ncbi:MAG: hypothetical protein EBU33_00575, partial [Sphingobacteriia bacterium]|nr:hypothetical protein [Sphingobacteriia bacterium]
NVGVTEGPLSHNWTFTSDGALTFPDESIQKTAYTGPVLSENFMVACGYSGSLMHTYEGIKWTYQYTAFLEQVYAVAWNGKIWVAGGEEKPSSLGSIIYSSDGINWKSTYDSKLTICNGVAWNGNMWVAVGTGANIIWSLDGIHWSNTDSNTTGISPANTVAWNGTYWLVGGTSTDNIGYSTDGRIWSDISSALFTSCKTIAWNGSLWVAGGSGDSASSENDAKYAFATSTDGLTWNPVTSFTDSYTCYTVAWNGIIWVAGIVDAPYIAYSPDGLSWSTVGSSPFTAACNSLTWNGSLWYAGDAAGNIAYSSNDLNWALSVSGTAAFYSSPAFVRS